MRRLRQPTDAPSASLPSKPPSDPCGILRVPCYVTEIQADDFGLSMCLLVAFPFLVAAAAIAHGLPPPKIPTPQHVPVAEETFQDEDVESGGGGGGGSGGDGAKLVASSLSASTKSELSTAAPEPAIDSDAAPAPSPSPAAISSDVLSPLPTPAAEAAMDLERAWGHGEEVPLATSVAPIGARSGEDGGNVPYPPAPTEGEANRLEPALVGEREGNDAPCAPPTTLQVCSFPTEESGTAAAEARDDSAYPTVNMPTE